MKQQIPGKWEIRGEAWEWRVERSGTQCVVHLADESHSYEARAIGDGTYVVTNASGETARVSVTQGPEDCWITVAGRTWRVQKPPRGGRKPGSTALRDAEVKSPMPGKVVLVEATEGASVEDGELLVVVEAMKMEHPLRAPYAGVGTSVRVAAGQSVKGSEVLVVVDPEEQA